MTTTKPKLLSDEELKQASDLLKVLSHPTRLRLLIHLTARESSVAEMERKLEIRQPSLSQHLGELREAAVVTTRREHKLVFYTLTDARMIGLLVALPSILGSQPLRRPIRHTTLQQARCGNAAVFAVAGDAV